MQFLRRAAKRQAPSTPATIRPAVAADVAEVAQLDAAAGLADCVGGVSPAHAAFVDESARRLPVEGGDCRQEHAVSREHD